MSKRLENQLILTIKGWDSDKWDCYEFCKRMILNAQLTGEAKKKDFGKYIDCVCKKLKI